MTNIIKLKKFLVTIGCSVLVAGTLIVPVSAENVEYTFNNMTSTLASGTNMENVGITTPEERITEDYWVDLEKVEFQNTTLDGGTFTYYGVWPQNILKPTETALKDMNFYVLSNDFPTITAQLPNSGISPNSLSLYDDMQIYRKGWLVGDDTYGPPNTGRPKTDPVPEYINTFKFKETDLLSQAEVENPLLLQTYADLSANELDSAKVGEISQGSPINLSFTTDVDWVRRHINGTAFTYNRVGYMSSDAINAANAKRYAKADAQLVFSIKIPDGVKISDTPTAKISGLKDFTTEVKVSENQRELIVSLRLDESKIGKSLPWNDFIAYLNTQDQLKNIKLDITGLTVDKSATLNQELSIDANIGGFVDYVVSPDDKFEQPTKEKQENSERRYLAFAAKQSDTGRDAAAPDDKPNLISYTFKVTAPAQHTVKFINDSNDYASVKVENNSSISGDTLTDQSMPENPSKEGYTFKEWNTAQDGTGTSFTGDTVVTADTTVYAVYQKNETPVEPENNSPKLTVTDKTINKGETLDLLSLVTSATDKEDGDLKNKVVVKDNGGFDSSKPATYTITYEVVDSKGASVTATAKVTVRDVVNPEPTQKTSPEIAAKDIQIYKGDNLDLKSLVTKAYDKEDGNLMDKVIIKNNGGFDANKVGTYTITFEVTDSKGATAIATAKVTVVDKKVVPGTGDTPSKNSENGYKSPKTGDNSHIGLYGMTLMLSLMSLLGVVILKKRKLS